MIGNISTRGCISSQKFSPKYEVKSFRQESWQQYRYLFRNMKLSQHLKQSGLSGHRSRWVNIINIFLKNIHFIFLPEWHCSLDFWCYCNICSVALRKCAELWTKLNQSTGRGLSISVCGSNVEHKSTNVNPLLWMFYHFWDANNHLFDLPRARAVQILQFLKTWEAWGMPLQLWSQLQLWLPCLSTVALTFPMHQAQVTTVLASTSSPVCLCS